MVWLQQPYYLSPEALPKPRISNQFSSPCFHARIQYIILHYTAQNLQQTLKAFALPSMQVSAHYLIPADHDRRDTGKSISPITVVPEEERAWHAGESQWKQQRHLNDHSIGIELVNQTKSYWTSTGEEIFYHVDFSPTQVEVLAKLLRALCKRYPRILPTNILGHSDIAMGRKTDPGPRFPWQYLYEKHQLGAWIESDRYLFYLSQCSKQLPDAATIATLLALYGYPQAKNGTHPDRLRTALSLFQLHFVPHYRSGEINLPTCATLYALVEKYYPAHLPKATVATKVG